MMASHASSGGPGYWPGAAHRTWESYDRTLTLNFLYLPDAQPDQRNLFLGKWGQGIGTIQMRLQDRSMQPEKEVS